MGRVVWFMMVGRVCWGLGCFFGVELREFGMCFGGGGVIGNWDWDGVVFDSCVVFKWGEFSNVLE